ncbi:hypothetical protein SLS61_001030 [Didymella pomorum]
MTEKEKAEAGKEDCEAKVIKCFQILYDEYELLSKARTSDLERIDEIEARYQQDEKQLREAAE